MVGQKDVPPESSQVEAHAVFGNRQAISPTHPPSLQYNPMHNDVLKEAASPNSCQQHRHTCGHKHIANTKRPVPPHTLICLHGQTSISLRVVPIDPGKANGRHQGEGRNGGGVGILKRFRLGDSGDGEGGPHCIPSPLLNLQALRGATQFCTSS